MIWVGRYTKLRGRDNAGEQINQVKADKSAVGAINRPLQ